MRKRQFKKVLSLVLALAMVFTMNTSVFATGTVGDTDTPVVETQPEAQPETPVNNETENPAPSEEPAAEPEAPAVETTPEPVAEAAPAPEAQPEPAVGSDEDDLKALLLADDWGNSSTVTTAGGASFSSHTLTLTSTTEITLVATDNTNDITLDGDAPTSPVVITGASKPVKVILGTNINNTQVAAGTFAIKASTTEGKDFDIVTSGTALAANTEYQIVAYNTSTPATAITGGTIVNPLTYSFGTGWKVIPETGFATGSTAALTMAALEGAAVSSATDYYAISLNATTAKSTEIAHITVPQIAAAPTAIVPSDETSDGFEVTSVAATDEAMIYKGSDFVKSQTFTAAVQAKTITGLDPETVYTVKTRTASTNSTFASAESDPVIITTTAADDALTVSGLKFIPGEEAEVEKGTSVNGIYTVEVKKGTVQVEYVTDAASQKPVSIDVAEGATLEMKDDGVKTIKDGSKISLKGSGTVLFVPFTNDAAVFPKAFYSVDATLSLSGNNASILLSANNAGTPEYIPVVKGKDAAAKIKGGKLAVATLTPGTAVVDATNYIMSGTGALELLSANKTDFTSVANRGLIKASENRIEGVSVKYGETIIYATNADTLNSAGVMTIPNQSSNLWTPHIVTGMAVNDGIVVSYDTDQDILVNEDGEKDKGGNKKYTYYEFVLSSNASAEAEADACSNWTTGTEGGHITKLTKGGNAESGKTYYLYARRKATSKEYKSKVIRVGQQFTTLKKVTISLNLANASLSPNYIGSIAGLSTKEKEALEARTDIINKNFFSFVPHDFGQNVTFEEDGSLGDTTYNVKDSDGFVLGTVTVHFGEYSGGHAPSNIDWSGDPAYWNLNAANDGKERHYAAYVTFTHSEGAQTIYNDQSSVNDSGIVSFNIIKAPTKFVPEIESPAISKNVAAPTFKAYSVITGKEISVTTDPSKDRFYIDGKKADSTSWNKLKAGTYKITVSGEGLTSVNYEVSKEGGKADYSTEVTLKVVDKDSSDGLKVTASKLANSHVYYGTNFAGLKSALSVNYTFGGETLKWTTAIQSTANAELVVLNSTSSNAQKAPASMILANKEIDKLATVSGGTTVYAYYVNAPYTINGEKLVASSNAVEVKIEPRPVKVTIPDNANALKTKRGSDLISKISSNKLKVEIANADGNYAASGAKDVPASTGVTGEKFFAGKEINLNTSTVDKNVPGSFDTTKDKVNYDDYENVKNAYAAFLTGYTISSDYAQNYVINKSDIINEGDKLDYVVEGRYYISYILEYGGQGAKTGQRHVSTNVIDQDYNTVYNVNPSGTAKITESWNIAGFKLPETDKIVSWEIKRADTHETLHTINNYAGNQDETLTTYDIAVYAVVAARATKEGVMAKSITPVNYYGMAHVEKEDGTTTKVGDLTVELYDEGKTVSVPVGDPAPANYTYLDTKDGKNIYAYNLVKGTDYTLSYKNNTNASVAYDETVSGENNVKRIVDDKKMPQVIVKGKNNYKSLKTTILFDILPTDYSASLTEALTYQQAGKNLNTKANVTKVLPKKLSRSNEGYYDSGARRESTKTYKLRAGKFNASKRTYTGDYIMNVYRQETTGERTLLGEAKDLKKIPAGTYVLQFKGVNNYRGTNEVTINVKNWTLLSQQKFKWTKKVPWAEKITVANFKIEVTNKKTKAPIALVKYADQATQAGYYIRAIYDNTRGGLAVADAPGNGDECSEYNFDNAGNYTIYLQASQKLMETADIAGTHTLKVDVTGTKLKTSDFTINNTKANKTVIIDYDGKPTEKPVEVKIANGKLTVDPKNKIPVALGSEKKQVGNAEDAVRLYTSEGVNGGRYLDSSDGTYQDSGATYTATLSGKGVYTLSPVANNSSIYETYKIRIVPSGKYYGPNPDGSITLTYKRGNIDLKKALGGLVKITEVPVEVNIGGTNADLRIEIAGMNLTKTAYDALNDNNKAKYSVAMSGNTVITTADGKVLMAPYTDSVGKQHVKFDGNDIFDITYTGNKKVGKGKATIKPTKYGKSFFKGNAPVDFNIKQRTVNEVLSMDAITTAKAGDIIAEVNDAVAPKSGSPKVNAKLYQVAEFGGKLTKLNAKDATITAGTEVKSKGFPIVVTAGSSGNFKFVNLKKETKVEATDTYFNVYGKKGRIKVTLSDGKAPGCVYDAAQKGYVYTGDKVDPKVTKIEIDGTTYSFPAGISTSSNFTVKYENDVKVGSATATITLKRNPKAVSGNEYPVGGSVKVKYKIIPHKNTDLVLEK